MSLHRLTSVRSDTLFSMTWSTIRVMGRSPEVGMSVFTLLLHKLAPVLSVLLARENRPPLLRCSEDGLQMERGLV